MLKILTVLSIESVVKVKYDFSWLDIDLNIVVDQDSCGNFIELNGDAGTSRCICVYPSGEYLSTSLFHFNLICFDEVHQLIMFVICEFLSFSRHTHSDDDFF